MKKTEWKDESREFWVGRDNSVLDENFVPITEGVVRCRTELGRIIREYYRDAA